MHGDLLTPISQVTEGRGVCQSITPNTMTYTLCVPNLASIRRVVSELREHTQTHTQTNRGC